VCVCMCVLIPVSNRVLALLLHNICQHIVPAERQVLCVTRTQKIIETGLKCIEMLLSLPSTLKNSSKALFLRCQSGLCQLQRKKATGSLKIVQVATDPTHPLL